MLYIVDATILIGTILILCMPLILWLYLYQAMTPEFVRRRYIIFGMFLGALVTLPLLFHGVSSVQFLLERVFSNLYRGSIILTVLWLTLIITLLHVIVFIVSSIYLRISKNTTSLSYYIRSTLVMLCCSTLFFLLYYLFSLFSFSQTPLSGGSQVIFNIAYSSVVGIVGYYLIVSCLEEFSKYIAHLTQSYRSDYRSSLSRFILFSLSLALGFSFFENILYTWMMYRSSGLSLSLLELAFFRSLFSLSLHLLCTLLFSLGMWYFWKYIGTKNPLSFITRGYVLLLLGSIFFHSIFNLSLSFGYIGVVLLSVFGLYTLIAYIVPQSLTEHAQ